MTPKKVIVIGAGIAGISAAAKLQTIGYDVVVLVFPFSIVDPYHHFLITITEKLLL